MPPSFTTAPIRPASRPAGDARRHVEVDRPRGFWKVTHAPGTARLTIELHEPADDEGAVLDEGTRLLDFLAPDAERREVSASVMA